MDSKTGICVFVKHPTPGAAKTRLISVVGEKNAAKLAVAFFQDVFATVKKLSWAKPIITAPEDPRKELEVDPVVPFWLQGPGDLGSRLEQIFIQGLKEFPQVFAIGGDSPGLPLKFFEKAREVLANHDAVIGPCQDGGFYLLGLKACPQDLFLDLPWSQPTTCAAMVKRLKEFGFQVKELPLWFDVDWPQDLIHLKKLMQENKINVPKTAQVLNIIHLPPSKQISVIIPTWNEEKRIGDRLTELSTMSEIHEILVVDGGSLDQTLERVKEFPHVKLFQSSKGRAAQMNFGAQVSSGEVLLFLHADVQLPPDAPYWIEQALEDENVVAGAFKTWIVCDRKKSVLSPFFHLGDLRSRYTKLPYGDQALFVRKTVFKELGGFPNQPLMEDLEFSRRLKKIGRIQRVPACVKVSGRRWIKRPIYYFLLMNTFPFLYVLGVSPKSLARFYGAPR